MNEPTLLQEITEPPTTPAVPLPPADPIGHGGPQAPRGDGFSGKPQDLQKDLALLAAQQQPPAPAAPPTPAPAQPAQPQAAATPAAPAQQQTQPPEVPEKFRNPDGTVNQEALAKSTVNVEQALERYRQKEIELRRAQNNVHRLGQGLPVPPPAPAPQPPAQPQAPGAQQGLADLINAELAANPNNPGMVLEKLAYAMRADAAQAALGGVAELQQEVELQKRERQVEAISKTDPWVLTQDGFDKLSRIRVEKPWVNAAPNPWEAAYREHLADQAMQQRLGSQVQMPTPRGMAAPVAPAVPANRAPSQPVNVAGATKDQIDAYVTGKSPAEVDAFYRSQGLPGLPGVRR